MLELSVKPLCGPQALASVVCTLLHLAHNPVTTLEDQVKERELVKAALLDNSHQLWIFKIPKPKEMSADDVVTKARVTRIPVCIPYI